MEAQQHSENQWIHMQSRMKLDHEEKEAIKQVFEARAHGYMEYCKGEYEHVVQQAFALNRKWTEEYNEKARMVEDIKANLLG